MVPIEASFIEFVTILEEKERRKKLKDKIVDGRDYVSYFNYELNPHTWNMLVNKQIYMHFERLLIERQLAEYKDKEDFYNKELDSLDRQIEEKRRQRFEKENED
jgi:hypothetical protein